MLGQIRRTGTHLEAKRRTINTQRWRMWAEWARALFPNGIHVSIRNERVPFWPACFFLVAALAVGDDRLSTTLPEQELGHDDLVAINVYKAPEFSLYLRVNQDGELRLPMVTRSVNVLGRKPSFVAQQVAKTLKVEGLLVDPVVTVTVVEYHSRPVTIAGAVKTPVTFQVIGRTTLLDALARAGGLTEEAGPVMVVRSKGGAVQHVDLTALLDRNQSAVNLALSGGEEIVIPAAHKIFVAGNVRKPGAFPVRASRSLTVLQLLSLTEGLAPYAAANAYVYRRNEGGAVTQIDVPMNQILRRKQADIALHPDDLLYIPDNRGKRIGMAAIERILNFGSSAGATALVYTGMR